MNWKRILRRLLITGSVVVVGGKIIKETKDAMKKIDQEEEARRIKEHGLELHEGEYKVV